MKRKYEYQTILINGPQKGVYAEFPFDSSYEFGSRKPVPVRVWLDGKLFEMSLLPCGNGKHWLHIRKETRNAIGKEEGDTIDIVIEKNDSPKTVQMPDYLQWLLENDSEMMKYFQKLPYSTKKFWIEYIKEPKSEDSKVERINRLFEYLQKNYSD